MRDERVKRPHRKARLFRALSGKSQHRIARDIGRSAAQVDQWERGLADPGQDDLRLLAERGAEVKPGFGDEVLALYETERQAFLRRSEGTGVLLDDLAEGLRRFCATAVKRLLRLPLPEAPPASEDRREAEAQAAALRPLSGPSRLAVVRFNKAYQTWAFVEHCCELSVEEASRSLEDAAGWARLALAAAKWMRGGAGRSRRVRGHALAHWANILRIRGDLDGAEACFVESLSTSVASGSTGKLRPAEFRDPAGAAS